ncbi:cupin domain-containing protein [Siccirubricoccus sp. KC 17139]|uniref:Cupin domain-containing protein n=1 Tax=Siccirubricoccus soli TaxID=2899147 RepID=A0ABT1D1Y4_9PROT|nr:cupin domain-containing protein [Siccirubricoccus soli]MCO6415925.1 cupin domain-containing protein [Siccirubricoccus soli]MCP2682057.1 cupin domain-containing protein [Siccirubricoccus soli]
MALHHLRVDSVTPFDYGFGPGIGGQGADLGRNLGSQAIGLIIQTIPPGHLSSRRHRHLYQEEILLVMAGTGLLHHGEERLAVTAGDAFRYGPEDPEPHCFENTGSEALVIWAFGNRLPHEICLYPDQGVAFVEGLGAEVSLGALAPSAWTEERRKR